MRPLLQEAQFACFEDDEGVSSDVSLPSFVISSPSVRSQPPKSFARVRALECSGSGSFYFQNESLRDRFVCWRVLKNVVLLREWSLNTTLKQNGIRLEFPAPVVNTGVFAVESWEGDAVTINVVTHAGTIHRFTYSVSRDSSLSIFSQANAKAFPEPKPATRSRCDVMQSLSSDEILTVALWVNEYNLVLGTDAGRVLGVNFGLPSDAKKMQEFAFSDESVVSWIWHGLIKTTTAKLKGSGEEERKPVGVAVVAMTCFQIDGDEDDDGSEKDVCVVTVSADCVLRAWSFGSQSCLGRQQLRTLVTPQTNEDDADKEEAGWEDEDLDGDDGSSSIGIYATHAKVVALSPTESDNCRLLVHLDTTAAHSSEIYLLRGDVQPAAASSAGAGGEDLALDTARVFTVRAPEQKPKRGLKMVDFAVDKNFLFSTWRSLDGDEVYIHPNPMALTGPKRILGQLVSSLDVQMQQYEVEDGEWLFDLKEEGVMRLIDDFFVERILLPGRFSRQNLSNAIVEAQSSFLGGFSSQSPFAHRLPKYKDVLVRLVSSRCVDAAGAAAVRNGTAPSVLRIQVWKELIALCTKHWRCENVPIGFATTTNALLPGAPVMLRRNRISLLFPSAPSITAAFVPQAEQGSTSGECVADIVAEVLPVFDAFPSQSFQSFIHREVADVASDWKVESFVALARHCVRLGLNPDCVASTSGTGQSISAELVLTRSILRLSKLLGGDAAFQDQVFHDLVGHLFPFKLWRGTGAYTSSSPKRGPGSDEDEEMVNDKEDFVMADATVPSDYYSTTRRGFFAGHEMCFAFDQVASRTIDEMCNQSLRVVLFLAYLVDTRPAFLSSATLSKIVRVYLPKSITVYQRWRLSRWVANQGITQPIADTDPAITSSATLMPPLMQMFLLDVNKKLNRSGTFKRALSVLQLASASNNVRSEEAHGVLATFTREILQYVSQPNDALVHFLQKRQQFRLLRAMFCCNLSDISLHGTNRGESASSQQSEQVHQYVRSIGECLACEGQEAVARSHDDESARDHARWCFQQAIRCFSICLSNFFAERSHRPSKSEKALEQFIYEVVGLLKETVPRGFYDQLLSFLWTVVTQALSHVAHHDAGEQSFAVQSFIWVNVFKYSVEERLFRDAHLALMHTAELSAALGGSENAADSEGTASECVNYLVKELYRYGHLDLICELQWGSLESHVEKYILWQAANATIVQSDGLDAGAVRYYNLLFTFYMRKQQPANAASSLYALALRLRLAVSTSKAALEAQRNALNAACNTLRALPTENRWVVRKLHTEELKRPPLDAPEGSKSTPSLSVVTLEDMRRELAVLDGKLRLLALGHSESVLLSTMDGDEVIALLVDAVHNICCNPGNTTLAERRRSGVRSIEVAADIAARGSVVSVGGLTKSLSRYCVASEYPAASISRSDSDLLWELLEMMLTNAASLEQYEVAAETVLDFWQQQGRKLALPVWLNKRLSCPTSGNPAKLLRLYLKHGLLLEGLQLVEGLLPDVSTMGGTNAKSAFSFQSQMDPNAGLPELPWIPYNLIDVLLDSTTAVLNQGVGRDVSATAMTKLREQDHSLRQQLSRYFNSVNALQQAQEAANLARNSIDLDL